MKKAGKQPVPGGRSGSTPTKKKPSTPRKGPAAKKNLSSESDEHPASAVSRNPEVSAEERFLMIQTSAYFLAEEDGFRKDPLDYWLKAEQRVAQLLDS